MFKYGASRHIMVRRGRYHQQRRIAGGRRPEGDTSIDGLFEFYDKAPNAVEKRSILSSLRTATRLSSQANYSNDLCATVTSDTKRIVDEITARAAAEPYEVLEHVEHHLLSDHQRAQQIATATDDRFGCKAFARDLGATILNFRDTVNANTRFVRYKTLVGYDSVMPPQWDDEGFDYANTEEYRRKRIAEYVGGLSDETENEWYATIERCAATKSNDMATVPLFLRVPGCSRQRQTGNGGAVSSSRE